MTAVALPLSCDTELDCPDCLAAVGRLCRRHEKGVLPQLAVNVGWLKLMGDPLVEQSKRQQPVDPTTKAAIAKAGRRNARKAARNRSGGPFGFAKRLMESRRVGSENPQLTPGAL